MNKDVLTQQQKVLQSNLANVSVPDFLLKTYELLEDNKHNSHISWSKDGTMLIIKKPVAFADEILPIFFKHSNLSSFIRQLNNYSFRKMKSKEYEYCFYHEMFKRGRRDLLKFIKRKRVIRHKSYKHLSKPASKRASPQSLKTETVQKTPIKRIHTEDNSPINAFQGTQIIHLRKANQQLREELSRAQAQSHSLSNAITLLADYYGSENIKNVIKMNETQKSQIDQNQSELDEIPRYDQTPHQRLFSNQNVDNSLFEEQQTAPLLRLPSLNNYSSNPFSSFTKQNDFPFGNFLGEGIETADNLSISPRAAEDQHINYQNIMNQPIGSINTKQEPRFLREDSTNSNFPFSKLKFSF